MIPWSDFIVVVGAPTLELTLAVASTFVFGRSIPSTVLGFLVTARFCHSFVYVIFQHSISVLSSASC